MFAQMHTIPVINVKANFFDGKCHNFLMALFYGLLNTPYMHKCFHLIGMTFVEVENVVMLNIKRNEVVLFSVKQF